MASGSTSPVSGLSRRFRCVRQAGAYRVSLVDDGLTESAILTRYLGKRSIGPSPPDVGRPARLGWPRSLAGNDHRRIRAPVSAKEWLRAMRNAPSA